MLGKPFLRGSGFMNTIIVQDRVSSARRVMQSYVFGELNDRNSIPSIEYVPESRTRQHPLADCVYPVAHVAT